MTELRARLADYIEGVRQGEELVVVQHGFPVARLSGIDSTPVIERLTPEGVIRPRLTRSRSRRLAAGGSSPRLARRCRIG